MPPSAEAIWFIARYIDFLRGMRSGAGVAQAFRPIAGTPFGLNPASNLIGPIVGISLAGLF
jgi:hypothetical protein